MGSISCVSESPHIMGLLDLLMGIIEEWLRKLLTNKLDIIAHCHYRPLCQCVQYTSRPLCQCVQYTSRPLCQCVQYTSRPLCQSQCVQYTSRLYQFQIYICTLHVH